jgi:hypothetical protein
MIIDKEKFLFIYEQNQFKTLSEKAQSGLETLIDCMNAGMYITIAGVIMAEPYFCWMLGGFCVVNLDCTGRGRRSTAPNKEK